MLYCFLYHGYHSKIILTTIPAKIISSVTFFFKATWANETFSEMTSIK